MYSIKKFCILIQISISPIENYFQFCPIVKIRYWQFTWQPYLLYPDETYEIQDNHMSVFCPVGISTKDEELDLPQLYWIPTFYVYYTSVLTNSVILLGLSNAPRNLFPKNKHLFYQQSKPGFRITVALATAGFILL